MDRWTFSQRFHEAARAARDAARTYVEEVLPDAMLFRVPVNSRYDGRPLHPDERVYPEDWSLERAYRLSECTEEEVVWTLWRDGTVPEWVDLSVIDETGEATLIEVQACLRCTANESLLYYGEQPFQVVGPTLPVDYREGRRFSIHHRSECWTVRQSERLRLHSNKIWALTLCGPEFDDRAIATLPVLPTLEILEFRDSPMDGSGLKMLGRNSKLRVLRIALREGGSFTVGQLPTLPSLDVLDLEGIPSHPWGFEDLASKTPSLSWLTLRSSGDLVGDGRCPPAGYWLELKARAMTGNLCLPRHMRGLSLHLSNASPEEIEQLLAPVDVLEKLSLRGTPIDKALVLRLAFRFRLKYLDVEDTGLDEEAVRKIASLYPKTRIHPMVRAAGRVPQ